MHTRACMGTRAHIYTHLSALHGHTRIHLHTPTCAGVMPSGRYTAVIVCAACASLVGTRLSPQPCTSALTISDTARCAANLLARVACALADEHGAAVEQWMGPGLQPRSQSF
jgi:hypothetical protein